MVEYSAESQAEIQNLMILQNKAKIERQGSLKKKREAESRVLLKLQHIRHRDACYRCNLNCEINHKKDKTFWGAVDGIDPQYSETNCPRIEFDVTNCEICGIVISKETTIKIEKPKLSLCETCGKKARMIQNGTD